MKETPAVITPTASLGTPNRFAALAETPESDLESVIESTEDIPDDEYLPNQEEDSDDDLSLSSISTMGSTDNTDAYSKAKISSLMERIQLNCTKTITPYKYTDVASFQEIMSNALVRLPSDRSEFGYSFLVDDNADHKERTKSTDPPDAMPSLPREPDYTSKPIYKKYLSDKKHYYACKQVTDNCIELLEDKFPECLSMLRTSGDLPRTLTLKEAISHVLEKKLSKAEKQEEFLRYTKQLSDLAYSHEPFSSSLAIYFGELERIRRLQQLVEPSDCKGMSYQMLCVLAHLKIHDGVGGRRDMVQELQTQWKAQLPADPTPLERWQDFKSFYSKKLEGFDYERITFKKIKQARSVISQETINQHTSDHLEGMQDQLDALTHAMSVMLSLIHI